MSTVILHTSLGPIKIELDAKATPKTCENFLQYAKEGFYDNTIFHRVIDNFMIQGGGFAAGMQHKDSHEPIPNEAKTGMRNQIGTVAMARTSAPHSASSQFFINTANNAFLDFQSETTQGFGYCAFAKVIEGMDVVNTIGKTKTTSRSGHGDVPVEDIFITKVEILETA
jgi:peptidyl-prolyl cis-trans isomerase B (cyclophilin B)